ncbi:hypothetical protein PINS_up019187 [Pythium insidiosum]|nr:hypothetical protein PINS_up012151 [Pythium insidiosum]GLE08181.1 hypothetical protein PINS_up019187 [Pythium insidiosum]
MKRVLDHGRLHPDKVIDAVLGPEHSVDGELSKPAAPSGSSASASASARRKSSAAHASSHADFSEIALHSVDE